MSELLNLIDDQVEVEQKEGWKITNDAMADWWLERKQEEIAEHERLERLINEKIEFYRNKLITVQEKKEQCLTSRDALLIDYFESIPEENKKKTKTLIKYQLPTGTLQKKFKSPTYIKKDDELLAYAKANAKEFVETKETVKWGEFKKQTAIVNGQVVDTNTGEVLPIELQEQPPVFEVKL